MESNSKSFLQKLMVWQGLTHSLHLALDHLCSNETLMPVRLLRPASSRQLEGLPKQAELLGGSDGVPKPKALSLVSFTLGVGIPTMEVVPSVTSSVANRRVACQLSHCQM